MEKHDEAGDDQSSDDASSDAPSGQDPSGDDQPSNPGTTTLHRLRSMDNPTWGGLVDRYFDRVYGWCLDGGLDEHTAADVAQEVFISALGSLHRYQREPGSTFGGWLRRICQRRIADQFRRRRDQAIGGTDAVDLFAQLASIRQSLTADEASDDANSDASGAILDDKHLLAAVAAVQTEFESDSWRAFWMATVDGRPATDIALELGMTRNAVYLSKSRILKRLRSVLGDAKNSGQT